MPYYGTKSHPLFGFTGDEIDNLRATVFSSMPEHGHAYSMGIWAGYYDSGDPGSMKLALYGTSSGNPSSRKSYTASTALNSRMVDASDGQSYDNIDLLEAVPLSSGAKYGLAGHFHGGRMAHGQNATADQMFRRSSSSSTPPDPMGYTSSGTETQITIWVNYEANVKPDVPTNLSPADSSSTTSTAPTFAADFRDDNETLPNGLSSDYLNAYQIQVRSVAATDATTGTLVWDSGTVGASPTEQTNRRFSKVHGGSALSPGQRYQWICRVQDRFGAWSDWTAWTAGDFLVSGAAIVTTAGNPTGRTTDTTPDFQGNYHHVSGTASTNVQVRLYIGSTLVATSPEIAKVVASAALPGTAFTITAAESTFGTLASGVQYSYQIRAKASGVWSDWSSLRTFKTNTSPTVPSNLTPSGGLASSSYPLLTAKASDPDGDSLTVSARIKDNAGSLLFTRTMTYDATLFGGAGGYKYQTTGTDLATYATYKWDANAYDGDLTSAYSGEAQFVYAAGPAITVTAPTDAQVLTSGTPTVTWTTTDQQKKQVRIYTAADAVLVHDSGLIVDTTSSYTVPSNVLINNTSYYLTVSVTNSAPLSSTSAARYFSLVYTAPDTVMSFIASAEKAELDVTPSVVRLAWDSVTTSSAEFLGYTLTRRLASQSQAEESIIALMPSIEQNTFVDTMAPPNVDLIYAIIQRTRPSIYDILRSAPAESQVTVPLSGSVLSDVRDGLSLRAVFDYVDERTETPTRDQTDISTWDGGAPWLYEGPTEYTVLQLEARLIANDGATVAEQLDGFRALAGRRADGSPVICCYRDERGRKLFGRLREPEIRDRRLLRADISMQFTEQEYSEIVEAAG